MCKGHAHARMHAPSLNMSCVSLPSIARTVQVRVSASAASVSVKGVRRARNYIASECLSPWPSNEDHSYPSSPCRHCKGLPGTCACKENPPCARPHYIRCNNVSHCLHCKGGQGTCMCPVCPQQPGSKCIRQHCDHCKGLPGTPCTCPAAMGGCPRPIYVACMPTRHCVHCAGRPPPALCECSMCPVVPGVMCRKAHCPHCRGFAGVCACTAGCSRKWYCMCTARAEGAQAQDSAVDKGSAPPTL